MLYQRRGVYTTPTHRKEIKVAAQLTFRSLFYLVHLEWSTGYIVYELVMADIGQTNVLLSKGY